MMRRVVVIAVLVTGCAKRPAPTPGPTPAQIMAPPAAGPVVSPVLSPVAQLKSAIDSMVAEPKFRNAMWGILIVDPDHNDTLYSLNADKLFLPASNMKIITGSMALAELGPDYQYRTTFATTGQIRHGVLYGDLVVIGRGDPTISDHMAHDATIPMRAIADSVAAHGIHRIAGRIVQGGDAFPDANLGYGWDWDDLSEPYAAGVDELMFNEGFTTIVVRGGARAGSPATAMTTPGATYPIVRNHVRTVAATGDAQTRAVTVAYDTTGGVVDLNGNVAPHDSTVVQVAYRDPAAAYLHAFAAALIAQGVALRANAADVHDDSAARVNRMTSTLDTLFTVMSPPLRDILPALLKPSQNQIAEGLLKTIGLEKTGVGSADSGVRVIHDQLLLWGAAPDGFVLHDGSGLSRHDYLSPETIVRVLTTIRRDSAFQVFYDGLPIAGVDGTIADRMRGTMAAGNVHAKTGFVDKARSLSGYVTTADGISLVFSFLCNNWTTPVREVEHVQDEIAARLAAMTLNRR